MYHTCFIQGLPAAFQLTDSDSTDTIGLNVVSNPGREQYLRTKCSTAPINKMNSSVMRLKCGMCSWVWSSMSVNADVASVPASGGMLHSTADTHVLPAKGTFRFYC